MTTSSPVTRTGTPTAADRLTQGLAVAPPSGGTAQPLPRASRGTPRFLRWLQAVAVAVCVACGIALVASLTFAYGQVSLVGRLGGSLAAAETTAAKLNAVDIAATGWAADPTSSNQAELTTALHDLGPELARLQTDGGPSSKDVVNGVLDYAMLVQTGLDADQPATATKRIVSAHKSLDDTVRPALDAFVADTDKARAAELSGRSTLLADIGTAAAVAVLVLLGIALARRTRRLLNLGLGLAVLLLIGSWLAVTLAAGAQPLHAAVSEASASNLPAVRTETSLAMASQNLALALKDPASSYAADTDTRLGKAASMLASSDDPSLATQLAALRRATRTVGASVTKGDWTQAAAAARTSTTAWTTFERSLTEVEQRLAAVPATEAANAQAWLLAAGVGATLAAIVAAAAAALGINQRLRDYR